MAAKHIHIFLADDDPDDRALLQEALEAIDPAVTLEQFENGKTIVERLTDGEIAALPDLIILDYNMPLMSGLDVLQYLAVRKDVPQIPKLIWSTSHTDMAVRRSLQYGAIDYFKKPVDHAGFSRLAASMLKKIQPGPF